MDTGVEELPDLEQVNRAISEYETIQWPLYDGDLRKIDTYVADMHELLSKTSNIHSAYTKVYDPTKEGLGDWKSKFFRVRPAEEVTTPFLRTQHSYPPLEHCKNLRANLEGSPVLYTSENLVTALIESNSQNNIYNVKNKSYWLSAWSIKPDKKPIRFSCFNHPGSKSLISNAFEFGPDMIRTQFGPDISESQVQGLLKLNAYMGSLYLKDEKYALSSYLAFHVLYKYPHLGSDILVYPSTRTDIAFSNFAMHPNFVDDRMSLDVIFQIKVEHMERTETGVKIKFDTPFFYLNQNGSFLAAESKKNADLFDLLSKQYLDKGLKMSD